MSDLDSINECSSGDLAKLLDSEFFKALADPSRLNILASLAQKSADQTVSEIAECCPQSLSVVSRHLKTLKDGGIVSSEKIGKEVIYRVRTGDVIQRLRDLADALEQCCPEECIIR